jgi:signal transduction histidine kinase
MRKMLQAVDWSQLWYPGPTRQFTADELQRAGGAGPGPTFWLVTGVNTVLLGAGPVGLAPAPLRAAIAAIILLSLLATCATARWLWRHPTRRRLLLAIMGWGFLTGLASVGLRHGLQVQRQHDMWLMSTLIVSMLLGTTGLWVLVIYRADQIQARLKELAERDEAVRLAHRLSAAQLQPHFLFNTLASIQHWVDTGDRRAGATLRSLTDYLRALLPMFEQSLHPLADELAAMQRYLEVMQARLGPQLRWRFEGAAPAHAQLPPGLALTLLENAVEHGVQASLHGAEVVVRCSVLGDAVRLDVLDTGPGLAMPHVDGVGLRNCRERLRQAFGQRARLDLTARVDAPGCAAVVTWPLHSSAITP